MGSCIGNTSQAVREWFAFQGVTPVSNNSGRKALAKWCSATDTPYHESFQVHADGETVWRGSYQPDLAPSGYRVRKQSLDLHVATAALRRFRKLCGRAPPPPPPPPGMSKTDEILMMMCEKLNWSSSFRELYNRR